MSLKPDIVLVGGGGHCKVVISIIKKLDTFNITGISDLEKNLGKEVLGIETRYTDDELEVLHDKGIKCAFVSLGSVGDPDRRIRLFEVLKEIGFQIPVIISEDAIVDKSVEIGEGTVIMPGAIINPGAKIGKNSFVNTGAITTYTAGVAMLTVVNAPSGTYSTVVTDVRQPFMTGLVSIQKIVFRNRR